MMETDPMMGAMGKEYFFAYIKTRYLWQMYR